MVPRALVAGSHQLQQRISSYESARVLGHHRAGYDWPSSRVVSARDTSVPHLTGPRPNGEHRLEVNLDTRLASGTSVTLHYQSCTRGTCSGARQPSISDRL